MKTYQATATKTGIAIGQAYILKKDLHRKYGETEKQTPDQEVLRFEIALRTASEKIKGYFYDEKLKPIFESYQLILEDSDLLDAIISNILDKSMDCESAIHLACECAAARIEKLNDQYLAARADDIRSAYKYVLDMLSDDVTINQSNFERPVVVISERLLLTDMLSLNRDKIRALVCKNGSPVSHLAIMARSYGIPYLCNAEVDISEINEGDCVIVDTENGELTVNPEVDVIIKAKERIAGINAAYEDDEYSREYEYPVKLYANISGPEDLPAVLKSGAEGIGLFRSEFLYLNRKEAPREEEQFLAYKSVIEGMEGKRVIIRTADIGADKPVSYLQFHDEENPELGRRAIRISLDEPDLFRTQLRALLRASKYGDVGIMYPFITSVHEIVKIRKQLEIAVKELEERGEEYAIPDQGVMIETPAAAIMSDKLAEYADFFSIGTNDLTQYTLAIDRQDANLEKYYDPHDEAVMRMIKMTVDNAHNAGIKVGLCGELGADWNLTAELVRMGVDEISVSAHELPRLRKTLK